MDRVARWWRTAPWIAVVALALLASAAPAAAAPAPTPTGPPAVAGLPVTEATRVLADWNKAVLFIYEPSAELDLDVDDVVVARVSWSSGRQPISVVTAARPVATLTLGRRVPSLAGLTRAEAETALKRLQFALAAVPATAADTWVVQTQEPKAETIVEFTPANVVTVTLRDPTVVEPREERLFGLPRTTAIALGGSFAALLILLLVLGSMMVRRAARRRAGPDTAAAEHVEVRVYAGQVVGPELTMRGRS